ncbi:polysaccharide pyruvyl transferase family protein [Robiginitalea aurantiaca]
MKYGLFTYKTSRFNKINIGDYIQSIAARQFLPQVDVLIERDELNLYKGDPLKIIMNGWFTHRPKNWPPSNSIVPLFVSFHLNKTVAEQMLNNKAIVSYFIAHQPIGCRDYDSMKRMKEVGIDAFYSGCLTTTLNYDGRLFANPPEKSDKILLVDVLFKDDAVLRAKRNKLLFVKDVLTGKFKKSSPVQEYLNTLGAEDNTHQIEHLTCYYDAKTSESQRFAHAENILRKLAGAKLVITSRIHIALPCLALGTPVLFAFGGKLSNLQEFRRLDGVINHMNVLVDEEFDDTAPHLKGINFYRINEIDLDRPPKNPETHLKIRESLVERCNMFI